MCSQKAITSTGSNTKRSLELAAFYNSQALLGAVVRSRRTTSRQVVPSGTMVLRFAQGFLKQCLVLQGECFRMIEDQPRVDFTGPDCYVDNKFTLVHYFT